MEGNLPAGSMIPRGSHGSLDLQGSIHMHHPQHLHASPLHHQHQHQQPNHSNPQGSIVQPPMHDALPPSANHMHECGRQQSVLPTMDYDKGDRGKNSMMSDEEDPGFNTEDSLHGHNEAGKGKKGSPWQRVKWTDGMVRLLITAVSYMGEDVASEFYTGVKRKSAILQKKGKWKSISKAMAERGYYLSPQQCEDKFNDLNKRYKRLTDILGRGTSCKVVENPALLDLMDQLSDKAKDDVRKILSSKQLFYEEMCSYHNENRLHLPADPALQRSLQLALRTRDEHDTMRTLQEDVDEDDHGVDTDDGEDDAEENNTLHGDIGVSCFSKRMKQGMDYEQVGFGNPPVSHNCNVSPYPQGISVDMNQVIPEGSNSEWEQKQWVKSRLLQLEERRLHIQAQMLELEKQRFKWQRFSWKKDRELEKMRMENEKMRMENEQLAVELKRKELEIDLN